MRPPRDPAALLGPWPVLGAALIVAALTAWRVAALGWAATDLYTDESQYWFWSTELAFGYYSKPPMIAGAIRLATELGGAETPFWVRLPAPVFHAFGAAAVGLLGGAAFGRRVGALSAVVFATLPGVSVGSIVISTDTLLLPFVALATLAWLRALERPTDARAAALGAAVGVGLYAKYAALFPVIGFALAALASSRMRLRGRAAAVAAGVALLIATPHLVWSVANGFVTAAHVAADAKAATSLAWDDLAEFLGAQFGVIGPILFPAWLAALALAARGGATRAEAALAWASAPVLAIVCAQALRGGAEPNWAAAAYAAATPLATALLLARAPRLLMASLILHAVLALAIPALPAAPTLIRGPDGRPVLRRLLGREDLARDIEAAARAVDVSVIVADNRGIASDLLYVLRDAPIDVYAPRPEGAPRNHFEMAVPLPADLGRPVLFVTGAEGEPTLEGWRAAEFVAGFAPEDGFFAGRRLSAWRMTPE